MSRERLAVSAHERRRLHPSLLPIVRRIPTYVRLAWALAREPAIPRKYRALLYSSAAYSFTPLSALTGVIPLVGQLDGILILLLGIRQALTHCPPAAARKHFARLNLPNGQLNADLEAIHAAAAGAGRQLGREARYLGRVAGGFSRRVFRRLLDDAGGSA